MTNVRINKDEIEDKQVVISIKHMMWAVSIIVTLLGIPLGWLYSDVTKSVDNQNDGFKTWKSEQKAEHKEWLKEEFNPMRKEVNEIYKDLGTLLERTSRQSIMQPPLSAASDTVYLERPPL